MIVCTDLTRCFSTPAERVVAVDRVSMTICPGTFACIKGASGSGKSTLLNLLAGLDVPTSGEVCVGGVSLTQMSEEKRSALRLRSIGVVFQDDNLIDEFTALENVALPLHVRGRALNPDAFARSALEELGVGHLAERYPSAMSGGQRQRVGIARAVAGGRTVLIADEPTGSLDTRNSRAIFDVIRSLCQGGATAVVATHDPLAAEYATVTYTMEDGRIS